MTGTGLLLAAPTSASGKTTVTLAIARALRNAGHPVAAAKSGPDYIDPAFHAAATGAPCVTLDAFAMPPARLRSLAATDGLRLVEGAMGLFDGAPPDGRGSAARLAGPPPRARAAASASVRDAMTNPSTASRGS